MNLKTLSIIEEIKNLIIKEAEELKKENNWTGKIEKHNLIDIRENVLQIYSHIGYIGGIGVEIIFEDNDFEEEIRITQPYSEKKTMLSLPTLLKIKNLILKSMEV